MPDTSGSLTGDVEQDTKHDNISSKSNLFIEDFSPRGMTPTGHLLRIPLVLRQSL